MAPALPPIKTNWTIAYGKVWALAQGALEDLLQEESANQVPRPQKDQVLIFQTLATFYVKYVQILRSLEVAYDQIVHPQKRRVIRQVLDGVMGRVLELKNEMVELEFSEFHYYDDVLQDLKLTPEDIEIPVPKYFVSEKIKVLKEREKILAKILTQNGPRTPETKITMTKIMSLEEAIRVIQVSERARQGRLRAKFMKEIRQEEEKERKANVRWESSLDRDEAATRIQKVWLGYSQRKKTKKERLDEFLFLGMVPPAHHQEVSVTILHAQEIEKARSVVQEEHEAQYQQAVVSIKDTIREVEGPDIKESLQEQIRQWFIECRNATGKFPDYPDEDDGGSAVIFAEKTPEQVSDTQVTPFHATFCLFSLSEVWHVRDESANFIQRFDAELVKEEKRREVEEEIRVQVDELMRQELKNLKLAVDRDKGKKKKKKKGKKGKKGGKKKKKEKDLTADRTIESLFEELIREGLLVRPPAVRLSDFIGEFSYLGTTLRQADVEPMPSLSDVRQLMALHGVLPLGSQAVHEKAPLLKTLLLTGPSGVGKKMLVHALCTETGANLFNLSPANISGKYPGKSGLQMMLHMVFKVARQLQPSVVWIGETEKTFYKKVPKAEKEMEPKRLKKDLPKIVKSLKAEDRVLIVGTTRRPFDADLKPFCKVYKKIILVPRPDYSSRLVLWRHIILRHGGLITDLLDLSSVSKVSDGYTQTHILQAVQAVLTERRIQLLGRKPLSAIEFIGPLARQDPIFKEEEEAFKGAKLRLRERRRKKDC
uniref:IQ motif containing with AAA domain 1 n=1 Tax=Erpetoichthys calabaricus TaxID=27687 RepID=A0A8C4TDS3_ERPCA